MSGLICSRILRDRGLRVSIVDKARGPGGRMSSRRTEHGAFDHGAQYFTARDPRFIAEVERWTAGGVVGEWTGRLAAIYPDGISNLQGENLRYVGVPRMSAVTRHLATNLKLTTSWQVETLERRDDTWWLRERGGEAMGPFDAAVVAVPAPQAAPLLVASSTLAEAARSATMVGCYAVMLAFEPALHLPFDGAFVNVGPLSWIACNSSKPGREGPETWVLHASPDWSEAHIEESPEQVLTMLLAAFAEAARATIPVPMLAIAHRWRYALPVNLLEVRCLFDPQLAIGACGDWCAAPRVEGAYVSGCAMAERILEWAGESRRRR